ncbi:MAG: acyltransferase [Candidatus Manganitrophus sp. SA1]|nr:acyltransferase [Candidatus Manganitrophus morganii]
MMNIYGKTIPRTQDVSFLRQSSILDKEIRSNQRGGEPVSTGPEVNLDYIDMLRGIAILGVLLVHSTLGLRPSGLSALPFHLEWLLFSGRYAVTLFFVVSAFTLIRSLHRRTATESRPIFKYFLRRFFRIAPAYYLVLFIIFGLKGHGMPDYVNPLRTSLTWPDLILHLFFLNSFFPYFTNDFIGVEWTISAEFLFYLLLPLIFAYIIKESSKLISLLRLVGLYLMSLTIYWVIYFHGVRLQGLGGGFASPVFAAWSYFFIASHLHVFIIGIGTWFLVHYGKSDGLRTCASQIGHWCALYALLLLGILIAYIQGYFGWELWSAFAALIFWALFSAGLVYLFDRLRPSCRPLTRLGKISFSVYLVHFPIFMRMRDWEGWKGITPLPEANFLIFQMVGFGVSIALAYLLYFCVEIPGIKIGKYLTGELPS